MISLPVSINAMRTSRQAWLRRRSDAVGTREGAIIGENGKTGSLKQLGQPMVGRTEYLGEFRVWVVLGS